MPRLGQESGRGIALLVAALMAATGSPALAAPAGAEVGAQPSEEDARAAKQLAGDGRELFFKEEYRAAIKAFESAHTLVPDPNLLFNISTAYEKLQEYDRAIEYLDMYAAEAPESEAAGIAKKRAELVAARDAAPEPEPEAEPEPEPEPIPEGPAPGPDPVPKPPADPEPRPKPIVGPLGWSLAGVSVVGLGLGIGFGLSSRQASSDGEAACGTVDGMRLCPASAQEDLDRARNRALVADVAFGASAAAAVATAVVVGVRLSKRKKDRQADVALTGTGARLRLRF